MFYISTAITTLLSNIPLLSIVGSVIGLIGGIVAKIIIFLWLGFDYMIVFIREIFMPILAAIIKFFTKIFLWIWKWIVLFFRLFIPACKADEEYCLKFDKKQSYGMSLFDGEDFTQQNTLYEKSIYNHFQIQLDTLYEKEKLQLKKLLKKASQAKKNSDMQSYNKHLVYVQTKEENILNNYYLSIDQHRLIVYRQNDTVVFSPYKKLHTNALHASTILQEALI